MPVYEYRCDKGHVFEALQRMSDDPLSTCETCSAPVQRVFHPVAVHFKGKGFYNTDYGTRNRQREKESSESGGGSSGSETKKDASSASSSSGSEGGGDAKSSDAKASDAKPKATSGDS
jgi:putative FmdB family regulatory protein